jgi:hypothetical protein
MTAEREIIVDSIFLIIIDRIDGRIPFVQMMTVDIPRFQLFKRVIRVAVTLFTIIIGT